MSHEAPRVRNLRKKLAQIAELERRVFEEAFDPSEEQLEKIERRADLEEELEALLSEAADQESAPPPPPAPSVPSPPSPTVAAAPCAPVQVGTTPTVTPKLRPFPSPVRSCSDSLRSPSLHPLRSPSMRWQDDPVAVEDVGPPCILEESSVKRSAKPATEILEGIQPFSKQAQASENMRFLLKEVSELSKDAFEEDALAMVTRRGGWKLTLLAQPEGSGTDELSQFSLDGGSDCGARPLVGFVVYRVREQHRAFAIAKIAIVPEHRGKGYGRSLIDWCMRTAKKQQNILYITLSSLPEAVPFYKKLGFRPVDVSLSQGCAEDEALVEGQVYMEYRIKGRGNGRKR